MAKPKYKPDSSTTLQQQRQGGTKKRKMQQFQRTSISSNQSQQKKRKLIDGNQSQSQQQQQQQQQQKQQGWKPKTSAKHNHQQELHQRPVIPYGRKDRILLIGEGGLFLSFRELCCYYKNTYNWWIIIWSVHNRWFLICALIIRASSLQKCFRHMLWF